MFSHFFQFSCVHCKRSIHLGRNGLCSRCQKQIKTFPYCGRCGSPLQHYAMGCGHCLRNEPAWDRIVIIGHYLEPLSSLIHRFKFQKQFWLDLSLSRLLYLAVREARRTRMGCSSATGDYFRCRYIIFGSGNGVIIRRIYWLTG